MPELNVSIPHQLPQEEALQRVKSLLDKIKSQHDDKISNLRQEWNGNTGLFSFLIMGFEVSGTLTVQDSSVELASDIPLPAVLFKGKIKSVIEEEGKKLLG
ncbi:MAG: hypothetical protein JWM28_3892 [Chitinophagaceae bacterium]|nr:hypothetical protein [Chitinophagaceae bacterium]